MSKHTGSKAADLAAKTLANPHASGIQKSLAGSVLSQTHTGKTTSNLLATKAAKALERDSSSSLTKALAGSVLSQKP